MKMSVHRKSALFAAIDDSIMDLRVRLSRAVKKGQPLHPDTIDAEMFNMVLKIWKKQKQVLNISD